MWLSFTYKAEDIQVDGNTLTCKFGSKETEFYLQSIDDVCLDILYNKETFKHQYVIQYTPSYMAIINIDKLKPKVIKYKKYIERFNDKYMRIPIKIIESDIQIIYYEYEVQEDKD